MSRTLDPFAQEMPTQEFQRDHPIVRQMEEMNRVDNLFGRHDDVDNFEIVLEAVTDENAAGVDEIAQLFVRRLERGQMFRTKIRVQIAGFDAREFRKVIDDLKQGFVLKYWQNFIFHSFNLPVLGSRCSRR